MLCPHNSTRFSELWASPCSKTADSYTDLKGPLQSKWLTGPSQPYSLLGLATQE